MFITEYPTLWNLQRKFRDYSPNSITIESMREWLNQFDAGHRSTAIFLLKNIIYFSEAETKAALVKVNQLILNQLLNAGVKPSNIIYVTLGDTASSSHMMLHILRDAAQLEKRGCHLIDSKNSYDLIELTNRLGEGALIYVDDFAATGGQFCESRDLVANNVPLIGKFAEFLLLPCICEEAIIEVGKRSVKAFYSHFHSIPQRPLHTNNPNMDGTLKRIFGDYCKRINEKDALGYKDLATMVVFYRNSPNTTPRIFRGDSNQKNWKGIFPRTTDLPIK